jgi:hypothetical protein
MPEKPGPIPYFFHTLSIDMLENWMATYEWPSCDLSAGNASTFPVFYLSYSGGFDFIIDQLVFGISFW